MIYHVFRTDVTAACCDRVDGSPDWHHEGVGAAQGCWERQVQRMQLQSDAHFAEDREDYVGDGDVRGEFRESGGHDAANEQEGQLGQGA